MFRSNIFLEIFCKQIKLFKGNFTEGMQDSFWMLFLILFQLFPAAWAWQVFSPCITSGSSPVFSSVLYTTSSSKAYCLIANMNTRSGTNSASVSRHCYNAVKNKSNWKRNTLFAYYLAVLWKQSSPIEQFYTVISEMNYIKLTIWNHRLVFILMMNF